MMIQSALIAVSLFLSTACKIGSSKSPPPEHIAPQAMRAAAPANQPKANTPAPVETPTTKSAPEKTSAPSAAPTQPASQALPRTGG